MIAPDHAMSLDANAFVAGFQLSHPFQPCLLISACQREEMPKRTVPAILDAGGNTPHMPGPGRIAVLQAISSQPIKADA